MKNKKLLLSTFLLLFINLLNPSVALAAAGDFGAWDLTKDHKGLNCGQVTFSEKELSLEFWIYIDDLDGKNIHETAVISNRHDGNHGFTVSLNRNSNNNSQVDVRFWFKTVNESIYAFWIPRELFLNSWNHLAYVISSKDKKATVYLNTEEYAVIDNFNGDWKGNIKTNGANVGDLWLAAWYDSPKFHGKLADFRVWNTARSIEDIQNDYKKVLTGKESGLQKYYTFDDEVFAERPYKLTIVDELLTWQAEGENWEVEVRSELDNSVLKSEIVSEKSYSLIDLPANSNVYIRTINNGFYSGWAFKADIIKVGCVGDSNTYGAEASDRSRYAWPIQIRDMLGSKYETRNFGVNGALMMNHLNDAWINKTAYLDHKAYDSDVIVIALGTNDSKDGYWNAEKFKNSYVDLIREFRAYPSDPQVYMAIPIKAYSTSWSINDQTIRNYLIPVMQEIAIEQGVPLIDLYAVTDNIANLMASDGIHPKDEGLQIMARKIADILLTDKPHIETNSTSTVTEYAAYYWYKNDVLIEGADELHYIATEAGNYKVAVKLSAETNDVVVSEPIEISDANTKLTAVIGNATSVINPDSHSISITHFNDNIQVLNATSSALYIYDLQGRIISEHTIVSDHTFIPTSDLPKGVYVCKLSKEGYLTSTKILK